MISIFSSFLLVVILGATLSFQNSKFHVDIFSPYQRINNNVRENGKYFARNMFSGIIEDIGIVENLVVNKNLLLWDGSFGEGVELTVKSEKAVEDAYLGCSIAVNGVCLTATHLNNDKFTVGLAPETLRRSNLGKLSVGSKVNVERALRTDSRNSGHFVQ
eukprot:gene13951-18711_t